MKEHEIIENSEKEAFYCIFTCFYLPTERKTGNLQEKSFGTKGFFFTIFNDFMFFHFSVRTIPVILLLFFSFLHEITGVVQKNCGKRMGF